jgi:hypothetical protein
VAVQVPQAMVQGRFINLARCLKRQRYAIAG